MRPTRKPATKTVAAASTQTGQTAAPRDGRSERAIQTQRTSSQTSGGYTSGIAAKTLPRLKNQSETENDSRTRRSTFADRQRPPPVDEPEQEEPRRTTSHTQGLLIFVPPNAPL